MNNTIYLGLFSILLVLATYLYSINSKKLFSRLNILTLISVAGLVVAEWNIFNASSYYDVMSYNEYRIFFTAFSALTIGLVAFLFVRPFRYYAREKLYNQMTMTVLVVSCFATIVFSKMEGVVTVLPEKMDGKWVYILHGESIYQQLMMGWYTLMLVMTGVCFYLAYRRARTAVGRFWKFWLFAGFSLYAIILFTIFIWKSDVYSTFDVAPFMFLLVSVLGWIYSRFKLFELNLEDAMNEILESVSNLVVITDRDFKVKYKNGLARHILFSKVDRKHINMIDVLKKSGGVDVDKFVEGVATLKEREQHESNFTFTFDGEEKSYFLVVTQIIKRQNHAGYSFVAMDISTMVEKEKELEKNNQELEHTNQELERFAYIASHDLKTPLRNIISFLSLLKRKFKDSEDSDVHEFMNIVDFNARSMHHLIEEILEYSLVKSTEIKMEKVDMNEVLFLIEKNLSNYLDEKGAIIKYGELPTIEANHHQMIQLFQNLIENGLKYNTSPMPKVTISVFRENEYLVFKIEDNGIGISPEYHKTVFEIFKRLHNQSDYQGSGVGLAICNKIVANHGGYIELISVENVGSIFMINLKVEVYEEALLID